MEKCKTKKNNNIKNIDYKIQYRAEENSEHNDDKKHKGYSRILRKLIKKKNDAFKNLIDNRFKKWKEEAFKGMFIRKTILVRISVSRDKIIKNRDNANTLFNKDSNAKRNRARTADKDTPYNKKIINKNSNKQNNEINNIQLQNKYQMNTPEKSKEKVNAYALPSTNERSPLINLSNETELQNNKKYNKYFNIKKNLNEPTNNILLIELNKNRNNKSKLNNFQPNNKYNKNTAPIIYHYEVCKEQLKPNQTLIQNNAKEQNNKYYKNNFTREENNNYQGYHSFTNIFSPDINKLKTNSIYYQKNNDIKLSQKSPYNTRKYISLNTYSSETKINVKKYHNNNYIRSNFNKYESVNYQNKYNTRTSKNERNLKKKIDNEILKKGVTTVIQHYLGVREKFDNYNIKRILPN